MKNQNKEEIDNGMKITEESNESLILKIFITENIKKKISFKIKGNLIYFYSKEIIFFQKKNCIESLF